MAFKIVIWDLDETFWKGTLSEGEVFPIDRNIEIVKKLTDRGIINSIVSKNDESQVLGILNSWNVSDLFVFNSISWSPKGERVKALLADCGLRAENALFVDDNKSNLGEVEYYNPGITCVLPSYFDENDVLTMKEFKGKDDAEHSRLKVYKQLEKRQKSRKEFTSNEDFLKCSCIKISIEKDCVSEISRIAELVERTNQLNFTKNRSSLGELKTMLSQTDNESAFIRARDKFCDYGIIGFYLINNKNELLHFLFSCRVLGLGIENYVYKKLGAPTIHIVGEVAVNLDTKLDVSYIKEEMFCSGFLEEENSTDGKNERLLMIGGCDLASASKYLNTKYQVDKEFNTVINGYGIRTSDTMQLIYAKELPVSIQDELCKNLSFMDKTVTYATKLYSGKYSIIVISLVDDYIRGMYRHKTDGYYVTLGGYWDDANSLKDRLSPEDISYLNDNFIFVGRESREIFRNNLIKLIQVVKKECKLIFINGCEIDVSDWIGEDRVNRNIEMNQIIDEVIREYPHVGLVDMRQIITTREQLAGRDNRHYNRQVYYEIAKEIARISSDHIDDDIIVNNMMGAEIMHLYKRIKRKVKRVK